MASKNRVGENWTKKEEVLLCNRLLQGISISHMAQECKRNPGGIEARMKKLGTEGGLIIYILQLEKGKYYVGSTINLLERLHQHKGGIGSSWTSKYRLVELEEIYYHKDRFDEDAYTKRYMERYGIDNVRGGSYVMMELSEQQKELLERELATASNLCFLCKSLYHYIADCPSTLSS